MIPSLLDLWHRRHRPAGGRVLVVAIHKSGTNLVSRLLRELGYRVTGEGIDNRRATWASAFDGSFIRKFPERTAYFMHSLPLDRIPADVASAWTSAHDPHILFHYRDPRAVLASLVNYLLRRNAGAGHSASGYQTILADLLEGVPAERRVQVVVDSFPQYIRRNFEDNQWLLHHPAVCKTTFEDLVGAAGGGSAALQAETVARVAAFLGMTAPRRDVTPRIFDPSARTFHRGQADAWREAFRAEDLAAFERLYGDVLDAYGYPRRLEKAAEVA